MSISNSTIGHILRFSSSSADAFLCGRQSFFSDYSALARNDAPCTWVEYSGRVWSSYIGLCQSILEKVQQLLKLNYCSFGESYHSLIVGGGKGCSNTKVNKTRIWWEAMIRSLVRRFCQKQLSLKTFANYSFLKRNYTNTIIRYRSRIYSSDKLRWSLSLSEHILSISSLVLVICNTETRVNKYITNSRFWIAFGLLLIERDLNLFACILKNVGYIEQEGFIGIGRSFGRSNPTWCLATYIHCIAAIQNTN